jgi:hypothetical protein
MMKDNKKQKQKENTMWAKLLVYDRSDKLTFQMYIYYIIKW